MKILSNKTWYEIQTKLSELEVQVNSLQKENQKLTDECVRLKTDNKNLGHQNEKLTTLYHESLVTIERTGVARDKNGRYVSTKKK